MIENTNLKELLTGVESVQYGSEKETPVSDIVYDSRLAKPGSVFIAISGHKQDGHDFVDQALADGCVAAVVEKETGDPARQVVVKDTRLALAVMSANLFGHPSSGLKLLGVTGTNGKTTCTYLIESILKKAGYRTGLLGTVEYKIADEMLPVGRTTPESYDLQKLLSRMVKEGVKATVMEVSSHALELKRVYGCDFDCKIFTNLSQDHLDFHGDMEKYFKAKNLFFEHKTGVPVINMDDPFGRRILKGQDDYVTYAIEEPADVRAENIESIETGSSFDLVYLRNRTRIDLRLMGRFNVYNALASGAAALSQGIDFQTIKVGLEGVGSIPGRFETVDAGQKFKVIVDYAHTPDSLRQAMTAARSLAKGRVITVFGCGGDRDQEKRPMMGKAAAELSDKTIITSDNPRSEDPESIISQVAAGFEGTNAVFEEIGDRKQAIERALKEAAEGDVVLIAGKGHEKVQEFKDETVPFDDRDVAIWTLQESNNK